MESHKIHVPNYQPEQYIIINQQGFWATLVHSPAIPLNLKFHHLQFVPHRFEPSPIEAY